MLAANRIAAKESRIPEEKKADSSKENTASTEMVAACLNGIPILKMPHDLAEALGFVVTQKNER